MSQNTHEELWKQIDGFPNYQVSDRGRVKNIKNGKILKNKIEPHGYAFVQLYKGDGKSKWIAIHRLVATAFIPNPDNLPQVNHLDEVKTNNNVENLKWCTASQNTRYSAHKFSCKINQLSLDGELINTWDSSEQIKRETGYNNSNIIQCCKGKYNQAYGFKWEYADTTQQKRQNRPVAALTKDGDLIAEYKSVAEAARCFKISNAQIRNCLNGTYKSTHGLRFIYID